MWTHVMGKTSFFSALEQTKGLMPCARAVNQGLRALSASCGYAVAVEFLVLEGDSLASP